MEATSNPTAEVTAPLLQDFKRAAGEIVADSPPVFDTYQDAVTDRTCYCAPSWLSSCLCLLGLPLFCAPLCGACLVVHPREEYVITVFGRYYKTLRRPGLFFFNPCGREVQVVSTQNVALELDAVSSPPQRHPRSPTVSAAPLMRGLASLRRRSRWPMGTETPCTSLALSLTEW